MVENVRGRVLSFASAHKNFVGAVCGTSALVMSAVPVLAVEETPAASLPSLTITQDMLTPLVEGVVANVSAILPVCLGLFALFLGIRIVPALISRFTH